MEARMPLAMGCCCWVWCLHQKKRWKKHDDPPLQRPGTETFLIPNWGGYKQQLHLQRLSREAVLSMPSRRGGGSLAGMNSGFRDAAPSLLPLTYDGIFGQSHLCHSALKALRKGYCREHGVVYCSREIIRKFLGKNPSFSCIRSNWYNSRCPQGYGYRDNDQIVLMVFWGGLPPFFFSFSTFFFFFPFFPPYYHPGSARVLTFQCLQNIQCSNACHRYSDHPWWQHWWSYGWGCVCFVLVVWFRVFFMCWKMVCRLLVNY